MTLNRNGSQAISFKIANVNDYMELHLRFIFPLHYRAEETIKPYRSFKWKPSTGAIFKCYQPALRKILSKHGFDIVDESPVETRKGELKIQAERTIIQICSTHSSAVGIDQKYFLVHKPWFKPVQLNTNRECVGTKRIGL